MKLPLDKQLIDFTKGQPAVNGEGGPLTFRAILSQAITFDERQKSLKAEGKAKLGHILYKLWDKDPDFTVDEIQELKKSCETLNAGALGQATAWLNGEEFPVPELLKGKDKPTLKTA